MLTVQDNWASINAAPELFGNIITRLVMPVPFCFHRYSKRINGRVNDTVYDRVELPRAPVFHFL